MKSALLADWYNARVADLREWKTAKLVEYAKELGFGKFDATKGFSYTTWIAEQELRRLRAELGVEGPDGYPQADVTGVPFEVPGAVLDDDENDAESQYELPPFEARTDEEIANNYQSRDKVLSKLDQEIGLDEGEEPPHIDRMRIALAEPRAKAPDTIHINVDPREIQTVSADSIVNVELPAWLAHFLSKNANYGDRHRTSRGGLKGETVNLDRKVDVVWKAFWEGQPMKHEQPRELVWDLIGSCFLMLDLLSLIEGGAIVRDESGDNSITRELRARKAGVRFPF
jgi:hypothetical protein